VIQRLSFFGLGKLGLPLAGLFAQSGLPTIAIDRNAELIRDLSAGRWPEGEPLLPETLAMARAYMDFTQSPEDAASTDASIILVATPSSPSQPEFSSARVCEACEDLCRALRTSSVRPRRHLIVISSTMYPGTIGKAIVPIFARHSTTYPQHQLDLAYVPDLVALGQVVSGFKKPPLVLIGADSVAVAERVESLYRRVTAAGTPFRFMPIREVEIAKLACNVFLALKISFGNFLLQLGAQMGGLDVDAIAEALALDPRIGRGLLRGGAPYGGPCLPRDVDALLRLAESVHLAAPLASASAEINASQYELIERTVTETGARRVAVLGLSFKHDSPVTIGSPGVELARRLRRRSLEIVVFDPSSLARAEARLALGCDDVRHAEVLNDCWIDAEAVLICTPAPAFAHIAPNVPSGTWIVDPWGSVLGDHPKLVRIGRGARPIFVATETQGAAPVAS
jgi:UDPglucose 6-dehydrogenase